MPKKQTASDWMKGNKNAQVYDKPVDASLSLRCHDQDKENWKAAAAATGISLNQWVIKELNKAAKRTGKK